MKNSIKLIISLSLIVQLAYNYPSRDFLSNLNEYIDYVSKQNSTNTQIACQTSEDCPNGFFCKNNDCIAKKKEFDSCLSGSNEECACNKCISISYAWKTVCSSSDCPNNGVNKYNTCQKHKDCPTGYYCDDKNENGLCISKLGPERACHSHEMCQCGRCLDLEFYSRQKLPPISFSICSAC